MWGSNEKRTKKIDQKMLAKSPFFVFIVLPVFEVSNGAYNVCHSYYALANRTAKQQYECKKPMKKGVECVLNQESDSPF
jgi:hypothetical protein